MYSNIIHTMGGKGSGRYPKGSKRATFIGPIHRPDIYAARQSARRGNRNVSSNFTGKGKTKQFALQKPVIQRGPNPFPREYHVRMHYSHWTGLTSPATTLAGGITFRLNSLFDPDQTGVGHQPYQFDQLSVLYNKAIVYAAKVDITWSNPSADGVWLGYCLQGSNMAGGVGKSLPYLQELPYCRMVTLNDTGSQVRKQSVYVDVAKYLNITRKQLFADEDNNVEPTAGPAITRAVQMQLLTVTPDAVAKTTELSLNITYYAKMFGLKDPGQS